jgi:rhodanese-related sulfurtransferase
MKKIICASLVALLCFSSFVGCGTKENDMAINYTSITAEEAKILMDSETNYIIIDARTKEEFAQGHIKNAVLIPEYEIAERAEDELPDKDALILVYCRSGRRSKIASEELVKLGYTNVKEFGGIIDWLYEIVE